jgi:hypothetical protein
MANAASNFAGRFALPVMFVKRFRAVARASNAVSKSINGIVLLSIELQNSPTLD